MHAHATKTTKTQLRHDEYTSTHRKWYETQDTRVQEGMRSVNARAMRLVVCVSLANEGVKSYASERFEERRTKKALERVSAGETDGALLQWEGPETTVVSIAR